ncbi:DNA oxidative demethylase AlkB [Silvimonas iriomotensis]|uniref:Alpha-ketoglutarate-dependent dioxygenase AlkB n=1 Tax=Silvimonas iriomotensis TaxID=449662 RepID=A0ABQ2P805_9NEIS|nr:DNA oxidative demethylase AlkB [Silvimonas iriomotensis]GGP20049.1 alpha-ketoglutarate-dependent dioxygenase AlkB [Silvimonas iriomotensis]
MGDLFSGMAEGHEQLAPGAWLLRGFARDVASTLLADVARVAQVAPFRHLVTPGGYTMSVAMTNCGRIGWTSEARGYRYASSDPGTGRQWPDLPESFADLARRAAEAAGFADFDPDACLINRYVPGARLSLHQDRDENDRTAPIVSVSLGVPAVFQFGGLSRSDKPARYRLEHGDVVVWGGPSRFAYHGVLPVAEGFHPETGNLRINITFRKVF